MLPLCVDCSKAALTTPQKVIPSPELVELNMFDFSVKKNAISTLTLAILLMTLFLKIWNFLLSKNYKVYLLHLAEWTSWSATAQSGCGQGSAPDEASERQVSCGGETYLQTKSECLLIGNKTK